jgi:hypothetical protein
MSWSIGISGAVSIGLKSSSENGQACEIPVHSKQGLEFAICNAPVCNDRWQPNRHCAPNRIQVSRLNRWSIALFILSTQFDLASTKAARCESTKPPKTAVSAIHCRNASITGSGTDACTVTLSAAAPKNGMSVSLSSSNAAVSVPATVTVPANATSAEFTATVSPVGSTQTVTLMASAASASDSLVLLLNAAIPTLSLNTTSISFGDVLVNTAATYSVILTSTGNAPVTIKGASIAGAGFRVSGAPLPVTLNPGRAMALSIQFDPTVTGAASGQLTITSNSSTNPTAVMGLSGRAEPVLAFLSALSCSSASLAGSGSDACTVMLSSAAPSSGLTVSLSSSNTAVSVPTTVTVPASTTSAGFMATVSRVESAQTATLIARASSVSNSFVLHLNVATPTLSINASTVPFGNVVVNARATQYVTLTSTGTAPVTINGAALTGAGFTMSGAALPVTLSPNQAMTLAVQFDPTVTGPASGQLTIGSNSSTNPTALIGLSGTGDPHEVDLTWFPPISSADPVAGYNVYRSPSGSSTYQRLNSSAVTATMFTDITIESGSSYDYTVTSVDAAGAESVPSNTTTATIP